MENLWQKETDLTSFAKKFLQINCKQPVKGNLHIFSFSLLHIRLIKILQNFCIFEMAWSRAFQKWIIYHFLDNIFLQTFLLYNWVLLKKYSIFANLQIFLQILKVEFKSFLMMYHLSFLDIKHGMIFKYPSRDRVKEFFVNFFYA